MKYFNRIDAEYNECNNQKYLPLCFCHSFYQRSKLTDLFLARLTVSQCDNHSTTVECRQNQLYPPSLDFTQLIPKLANLSNCSKDKHCLRTIHSTQRCRRCQQSLSLLTYDDSYRTRTITNNFPTDTCFYLCQHHTSCGFLCLNRYATVSINCKICGKRKQNFTCHCLNIPQPSSSCLQSFYETTTQRWMQKRGFPAAAILGLLILAVILLVIIIKLIYYRLDMSEKRKNKSIQSQEIVVKIHRCDNEKELSVLLLKKT